MDKGRLMDFLLFVIFFGAGFVLIHLVSEWALGPAYPFKSKEENEDDCRKTNTMHSWHYDEEGWMRCRICKKKALDD